MTTKLARTTRVAGPRTKAGKKLRDALLRATKEIGPIDLTSTPWSDGIRACKAQVIIDMGDQIVTYRRNFPDDASPPLSIEAAIDAITDAARTGGDVEAALDRAWDAGIRVEFIAIDTG